MQATGPMPGRRSQHARLLGDLRLGLDEGFDLGFDRLDLTAEVVEVAHDTGICSVRELV